MSTIDLEQQVQSLRAQLEVLAARLRTVNGGHTLADLEGLLRDQSLTSQEEIDRCLYRVPQVLQNE